MMKSSMPLLKKAWLVALLLLSALTQALAQAPQSFSYQAVIRSNVNALIKDQEVSLRLSILKSTADGAAVYTETHTPTTNTNGLVSVMVGAGVTADDFSEIDWSDGPYFIKTETDPDGPASGIDYTISGTTQLLSVPYSLFALKANHADNAEQADNATTADNATYATTAGSAANATNAGSADNATNADNATYATTAGSATDATNATNAVTAQYVTNFPVNPYEVYVKAGATDGTGTQAKPFATIAEGFTNVSQTGTIHILPGAYSLSAALNLNKTNIKLKGYPGTIITMQAAVTLFIITATGVTIDGLTITSDIAYTQNFIQVQAANCNIVNNTIYGAAQSGPMDGWLVNRALEVSGTATNLTVRANIMHSLRQPAYFNPNSTGHIVGNVVYNTKGFVVVAGALFVFSGNSWGTPANAVDIALLVGTAAGVPYGTQAVLSANNSSANIQDGRVPE
jgi:hypothetical protein